MGYSILRNLYQHYNASSPIDRFSIYNLYKIKNPGPAFARPGSSEIFLRLKPNKPFIVTLVFSKSAVSGKEYPAEIT